jgi:hypothetical protein
MYTHKHTFARLCARAHTSPFSPSFPLPLFLAPLSPSLLPSFSLSHSVYVCVCVCVCVCVLCARSRVRVCVCVRASSPLSPRPPRHPAPTRPSSPTTKPRVGGSGAGPPPSPRGQGRQQASAHHDDVGEGLRPRLLKNLVPGLQVPPGAGPAAPPHGNEEGLLALPPQPLQQEASQLRLPQPPVLLLRHLRPPCAAPAVTACTAPAPPAPAARTPPSSPAPPLRCPGRYRLYSPRGILATHTAPSLEGPHAAP